MTIRSNELLLGFDAREMWLDPQEYWPDSRKKMYLLRHDVVRPLSTDTVVWRTVFEADPSLQRPQWIGPMMGLWEDLATLKEYMDTAWSARTLPYWIIAVTLQEDVRESEDLQEWYARTSNIIPALRDPAWVFLGYDVSDQWLLSGLSNYGYGTNESDIQILRDTYASALNEHHLFASIKPAVDFMHVSDEQVRAHAPFFVFGIWLIKKGDDRKKESMMTARVITTIHGFARHAFVVSGVAGFAPNTLQRRRFASQTKPIQECHPSLCSG